jgi:hypothetical protein
VTTTSVPGSRSETFTFVRYPREGSGELESQIAWPVSPGRSVAPEGTAARETPYVAAGSLTFAVVPRRPSGSSAETASVPKVPSRPKSSASAFENRRLSPERSARVAGAGGGTPGAGTSANVTRASAPPRLTTKTLDSKRVPFCPTVFATPGRNMVVAPAFWVRPTRTIVPSALNICLICGGC